MSRSSTIVLIIILIIVVGGVVVLAYVRSLSPTVTPTPQVSVTPPPSPSPTPTISVSPVRLETRLNTTATVGNVSITPTAVIEESRCPLDVQCIQAGTVRLQANVMVGSNTNVITFTLNGTPTVIGGTSLQLVDVTPSPRAGVPIPQGDYKFIFSVGSVSAGI